MAWSVEVFMLATVGVIVAVGLFVKSLCHEDRDLMDMRGVAEALGLTVNEGRPGDGLAGQTEPGYLTVEVREGVATITLRVIGLPKDVAIERTGSWGRAADDIDVRIGDAVFDQTIIVRGAPESIVVILDQRARKDVLEGVGRRHMSVAEGAVFWRSYPSTAVGSDLLQRVEAVIALAHGLSARGRTTAQRLFHTAMRDPVPRFRSRAAQLLWREHDESAEAQELADALMESRDPRTRIALARRIGANAAHDLLLDTLCDGHVPPELRIESLRLLEVDRPALAIDEALVTRLTGLVSTTSGALLSAVAEALRTLSAPPSLALLGRRFRSVRGPARRALASLIACYGPKATSELCELLRFENHEAQLMVIETLGRVGDRAAVRHLASLTSGVSGDIKEAALEATAAIMVRHGGVSAGGLSLAPNVHRGRLSATSEGGALAAPDGPSDTVETTPLSSA